MKRLAAFLILACLLLPLQGMAAGSEKPLKGAVSLSGAWALYPMVVQWGEAFTKLHPGVRFDISAGGAGKGVTDALSGAVDLGMVSRDLHPAEVEKGAWWVTTVKDAVVPVVSAANPLLSDLLRHGADRKALASVWITQETGSWEALLGRSGNTPLRAYTRSDSCGAAETWAKFLADKPQEDLKGVGVFGDPGLLAAVSKDPGGIGFNNLNFAYDPTTRKPAEGIRVLPLDANGNGVIDPAEDFYGDRESVMAAIADGRYPSPPARRLHLVAKSRPTGVVAEFLRWVITDGQKMAADAGYIPLAPAEQERELAKLK